jgi:zinc/manganese transport system permease protein
MLLFHYSFMLPALILCLVLAGIHAYFGYHIVVRGVIFVDLSLSQIAAFGTSVALCVGIGDQAPVATYWISLAFTLGGAVLFALLRKSQDIVPMEAVIGITYAGAIALSLLVLEKSAAGTEHIREMLSGAILTVSWVDVALLATIAVGTGVIHVIFRKTFFLISENPQQAIKNNIRVWWWDILFYATFGVVVTSSVRVAGVLPVFSLLTIPAVAALGCRTAKKWRLIFGWIFGIAGCILGLELSLRIDGAAGPSIIATLLGLLIICTGGTYLFRRMI